MMRILEIFCGKTFGRASGMKNLIRGHIYQLKKRPLFLRMSCSQLRCLGCIDPAFAFSGICIKPDCGDRGAV